MEQWPTTQRSSQAVSHPRQTTLIHRVRPNRSSRSQSNANSSTHSSFYFQNYRTNRQLNRQAKRRKNPGLSLFQVQFWTSIQSRPLVIINSARASQKASHPMNKSRTTIMKKKPIICKLVCLSGKPKPPPGRPKLARVGFSCMMTTCSSQTKRVQICLNSKRINPW